MVHKNEMLFFKYKWRRCSKKKSVFELIKLIALKIPICYKMLRKKRTLQLKVVHCKSGS